MHESSSAPQLITLAPMLLAGLRTEGDAAGSVEHWQRFRAWLDDSALESCDDTVLAIAYAPPGPFGAAPVVELCVPVLAAPPTVDPAIVIRTLGGRFVLASGAPEEVPRLLRAARAFASTHGLPFERGSIGIYRPAEPRSGVLVEAGVRIHD